MSPVHSDITQGLPRVEELFEARKPKGLAIISEFGGTVTVRDNKKSREVIVTDDETGESKEYPIPYGSRIKVIDGTSIEAGDELTEGSINPHDLLKIKGIRAVQNYLLQEVQRVYCLQGVDICDKHIEVIVRQMLKKIRIENSGDTSFLPGSLVDVLDFEEENERLIQQARIPAEGKQVILGITKAALATNSFLSAASFQETTKVLTDAAIHGRIDPLIGLKENVIIGKLIPAGTGMKRYRSTRLSTDARIRAAKALAAQREEQLNAEEIAYMMAMHAPQENQFIGAQDEPEDPESLQDSVNNVSDYEDEDKDQDLDDLQGPEAEDLEEMEEEMAEEESENVEREAESEDDSEDELIITEE